MKNYVHITGTILVLDGSNERCVSIRIMNINTAKKSPDVRPSPISLTLNLTAQYGVCVPIESMLCFKHLKKQIMISCVQNLNSILSIYQKKSMLLMRHSTSLFMMEMKSPNWSMQVQSSSS